MSDKNLETEEYSEGESIAPLSHTLRIDSDLYKDEDAEVVHTLIGVKRVEFPNNEEAWEVTEDEEVVLVLRGAYLTKKQKSFLRTPQGIKFIIDGYKKGWNSTNRFKTELKRI